MKQLVHPITFHTVTVSNNLWLAPLAGYTDKAFRTVAIRAGAGFTFTEMISAEAIVRGNQKTLHMAERAPEETIFGIQIFGSDARSIVGAATCCAAFGPSLIDVNCGCSVPKILKSGAGARLLTQPRTIGEIVRALTQELSIPVSVKIRSGWDSESRNYLDTAGAAVANGASLVTLHPRTRAQGFSGNADWSEIAALKRNCPVPVIGSGDLFCPEDAKRMFLETGCDGVMFARGAIGNPFLFGTTHALLASGTAPGAISLQERLAVALSHLILLSDVKGERIAVREMRKHFTRYVKGIPEAAALREAANRAESIAAWRTLILEYGGTHGPLLSPD